MSYITLEDKSRFKACYTKAVSKNKNMFTFLGREYLVSYAKYVIEYLEGLKNVKA